MPKVSVIIPAYNQAKYLEDALNSVRNQTFEDLECIIVNDGSTDNTEEITKKYVNLDKRFKYIYQENKGLAGARNTGIKASQGEYIGFLDSDDTWQPQMLEKTVNHLERTPDMAIVSGAWDYINESGKTISGKAGPAKSRNYLNELISGNLFPVHALLLRKEIFLTCGLFDTHLHALEDWDMWLRAASKGYKFGYIDDLIAHYRRHTGCMTLDVDRMRSSFIYVIEKILKTQKNPDIIKLKSYAYIFQWLYLAEHCNEAKKIDELKNCLREAERLYLNVEYIRKYTKRWEYMLECLPYSEDFLNTISLSTPLIWKFDAYSRQFKKKAIDNFHNKKYMLSFYNILVSSFFWPPRCLEYMKIGPNMANKLVGSKLNELKIKKNVYKERYSRKTLSISNTLCFIDSLKKSKYTYNYARSAKETVLYSSLYATMTLSVFNKLNESSTEEKEDRANYIQSYQCDDGLFRDPAVANEIAEIEDWWGWRHLTSHAIIALTALDTKARKPFEMLEFLYRNGEVEKWLESRDWKDKPDFVSNEILNYGTLLQYARDVHNYARAAKALQEMYDWLDEHQDPETGLWGPPFNTPFFLSRGVQTAYHIWLLYFYDKRHIQYIEKCIDSCLATQNKFGGFGVQLNSSACEDIDSIDPLVRFYFITDYRHADIKNALENAYKWVLVNMNGDGGFVFKRGEPRIYGHELMSSKADESAMFPTWFRTLSLAYLSKVVTDPELKKIDWNFVECPGYQFWRDQT